MKTFMANAQTVERKWYVVDADGMTLGRLASQVAAILRGKNKPTLADRAAETYERARLEGYPADGAQELAMDTLLRPFNNFCAIILCLIFLFLYFSRL